MRVTSKGQITIPLQLRLKTGITPGCEVEFIEDEDRIYIKKAADSDRGTALVQRMRGQGDVKMTTDEIMALTRGE